MQTGEAFGQRDKPVLGVDLIDVIKPILKSLRVGGEASSLFFVQGISFITVYQLNIFSCTENMRSGFLVI